MTWQARKRAWERERLDPARARAPERLPRFTTISDVEVARLYGPWDWTGGVEPGPGDSGGRSADAGGGGPTAIDHHGERLRAGRWDDFDPLRDIGFPGEPPFTRGIHPTGYRGRAWTMRMFAGFGAAEDTNARFRDLLAAGQTGLSIAFDMPTLYGYDTDDPEAEGEFGTCGVAVSSLADMEVLLDGLPLGRISTSMTINASAAVLLAMSAGVPVIASGGAGKTAYQQFHPGNLAVNAAKTQAQERLQVPATAISSNFVQIMNMEVTFFMATLDGLGIDTVHPIFGTDD